MATSSESGDAGGADPSSRVGTELPRIGARLGRGEFTAALAEAQSLLAAAPGNRDALYLLAVAQRCAGRIEESLSTLSELDRLHPGFGRALEERGHCLTAMGAISPAVEAYRRAVEANPYLRASWSELGRLLQLQQHPAEAQQATRQAATLAALPPQLLAAYDEYASGATASAEDLARRYLAANGEHVEGMRLLAKIAMDHEATFDAERLLERVLALSPAHLAARHEYAVVLLNRQEHVRARMEISRLLEIDPSNPGYRSVYAAACAGLGDYAVALPVYRELLAEDPERHEYRLAVGHAQKTLGDTSAAIASYREAAQARSGFGEGYWSLANLKTYRFSDEELGVMQRRDGDPATGPEDRLQLCFALGKALEDRGEFAESFRHYARGNALKRARLRYDPLVPQRIADLQKSLCTPEFMAARAGFGHDTTAPIFIVGLPRSGSTLIEQILASHSQVDGTMELAHIPRLVQELQSSELAGRGPGYPRILADIGADASRGIGDRYLRETLAYRSGRPRFIDKMPNNFLHIGLIHLIFPNATIIDTGREPMALGFGIYKQLFAAGQRFAYRFEDIAHYYRLYRGLMDHWDRVLPGRILHVRHEELVDDLESQVRRILDFCALPFEPACVQFHERRRAVHSASSEQVRQPLNRVGIDQWRHFEPWLGELKSALAAVEAPTA